MDLAILELFTDSAKSSLARPWSDGAYTYASDGHVAVRVPRIDVVAECSTINTDYLEGLFALPAPARWYPVPRVEVPTIPCPVCAGSGKLLTCPECDGACEVSWDSGWHDYEAECQLCDGDGVVSAATVAASRKPRRDLSSKSCESCRETGQTYDRNATVTIGGVNFAPRLLHLVGQLPNCEIGPRDPLDVAALRFDGGVGVIMPMRVD